MKFNWTDYLFLAQELAEKATDGVVSKEAKLRASISRAYYAAFWRAINFHQDEGKSIPRTNKHLFASNEFCGSPERIRKKLGKTLSRLSDLRVGADYKEEWPVNLAFETETALIYAKEIVAGIESILLP